MPVIGFVLATLLAAYLVLVQPILGPRRYAQLVAYLRVHPRARLGYYRRSVVQKWALTLLAGVVCLLAPARLRILPPSGRRAYDSAAVAGLVLAIVASTVFLGWLASHPSGVAALRLVARPVAALLPHTRRERLAFVVVAVTAGVTEEVLFRGFLLNYARGLGLTTSAAVAATSVAFGLGHTYQGFRGVLLTAVVGLLFATIYVDTRSLLVPIVLHTMIDLRVLVLPELGDLSAPPKGAELITKDQIEPGTESPIVNA